MGSRARSRSENSGAKEERASNPGKDAMTDMTSGTSRTGLTGRSAATPGDGAAPGYGDTAATGRPRRLSTETKSAFKTTEWWVYVAAVAGVLIASDVVGTAANHGDYFRADRAWLYIVILTIGYLVSRGLAKSGSRDPYDG
jgi:hypothetical protein